MVPFEAMGRDPRVMAHFPALLMPGEARAMIARQEAMRTAIGHCFWAVERHSDRAFLGFCGVKPGPEDTPIEGELEIGWRLARNHWGQGYAREAAAAVLDWAWVNTDRNAVFAMTTPGNMRSRRLMERLGMSRVGDGDFDHPALAADDPLRAHVSYAIERPARPEPPNDRSP